MLNRKPRGYDTAVQVCELTTQRLRCINRELEEIAPEDCLDPAVRRKVSVALENHKSRCEEQGLPCLSH